MNGVLLTALSGSQRLSAALDSRRRRFRRGNPLTEMARTISDLHIFAILPDLQGHAGLASEASLPGNVEIRTKISGGGRSERQLAQNPGVETVLNTVFGLPPRPPIYGGVL